MDARSGDAQKRRAAALRTRLLRHSAVADALDDALVPPPLPPRRVAGRRPSDRREAIVAAARDTTAPDLNDSGEPAVRDWAVAEPYAPAVDELIPFYADEPAPPRTGSATLRRVVVAGCAVAVLAGAGTAGYLLTHRPAHHSATPTAPRPSASSSARPAAASVQQAEAWIRANLPRAARLSSNADVVADLAASGYSAAGLYTSIDREGVGSFLVTTPDIRDRTAQDLAAAAQRTAPLRVAAFGTGAGRTEVALLVGSSTTALSDRLAQDYGDRRAANSALLSNPRVVIDPASRPWLAEGRVDLRAATIVALLASRTDVRLTGMSVDPGERAVDRPARTITFVLPDATALDDVLRALPAAYAPARTAVLPTGERQLTWAVGLAPAGL